MSNLTHKESVFVNELEIDVRDRRGDLVRPVKYIFFLEKIFDADLWRYMVLVNFLIHLKSTCGVTFVEFNAPFWADFQYLFCGFFGFQREISKEQITKDHK